MSMWPTHDASDWALDIVRRASWQKAKTVWEYAPHEYIVRGWDHDDVTEEEFDRLVKLVQTEGRRELWTPPPEWEGGKPMKFRYWYPGDGYAYWRTFWGRSMLNRESLAWQEEHNMREVL